MDFVCIELCLLMDGDSSGTIFYATQESVPRIGCDTVHCMACTTLNLYLALYKNTLKEQLLTRRTAIF